MRHHVDVHRQIGVNFKMHGRCFRCWWGVRGGQGARWHGYNRSAVGRRHGGTPPPSTERVQVRVERRSRTAGKGGAVGGIWRAALPSRYFFTCRSPPSGGKSDMRRRSPSLDCYRSVSALSVACQSGAGKHSFPREDSRTAGISRFV